MRRSLALLALSSTLACTHGRADEAKSDEPTHHHGHHGDPGNVNEHGYRGHHRFDDPAAWAAEFESPEREAWQQPDRVVASLGLAPDDRVADIGAGTGYFAVRFAAAVPQGKVYAVDIEPSMVEWLAKRGAEQGLSNFEAIAGGSDDPNLPEAVDVVFMCNVFHHLADAKAYFGTVARKLEPDGRVVIVDFRADNPDHAPGPPKAMRMAADEVITIMQSAGYELVRRDEELLEWQYVLEFRPRSAS